MLMKISEIKKLFLYGMIFALFASLYYLNILQFIGCKRLDCLLVISYGVVDIDRIKHLIPVLFWILPQIILTNQMGDYLSRNLNKNAVYIFTRTSERKSWMIGKIVTLFFYVFIYYAVQFIVMSVCGILIGFDILFIDFKAILSMFFLIVLYNYTFILMINIFSLYVKAIYSACTVIGLSIVNVFFVGLLYEHYYNSINILKYLPFTQGIYEWHFNANRLILESISSSFYLADYSLFFSIAYLLLLLASIIILGIHRIRTMDII